MTRVGIVDYFLSKQSHANIYASRLPVLSGKEVQVTCAWTLLDDHEKGMPTAEWCQSHGVKQCDTVEELVEQCDAIIVSCTDYCEMHEQLCAVPLTSGKPVFVEKVFAPDAAAARRMLAIAKEHNTPCYSASTVRTMEDMKKAAGIRPQSISAWYLGWDVCLIHTLEPVMSIMQTPVKRVMSLEETDYRHVILEFADGRHAYLEGETYNEEAAPFLMRLYADHREIFVRFNDDIWKNHVEGIVDFCRTGKELVAHDEMIEIMAAYDACVRAISVPGTWVDVIG